MTVTALPAAEPGVFERSDVLSRVAEMTPAEIDAAVDALDWDVTPWSCGPTWDKDPNWTGPRDPEGYILPHYTLGWQAIRWAQDNLLADETDDQDNPLPFSFTPEQMRFVLWFYALDPGDGVYTEPSGVFAYREFVLQRLKGWGKDPLAAVLAAIEFVGPCRFAGWAARDMPEKGLVRGDPVGKAHPRSWVQIAAVSLEQTQNTMKLFQGLFTDACIAEHSIDLGKETIYAYGGKKTIKAVTSSPKALEGNRPTLVIMNETHHWGTTNEGIAMADAIERNATKAKGGAARTLAITNAYEPSQESVARMQREAYEEEASGLAFKTGMCYDSLEAPREARLRPKFDEEILNDAQKESLTRRYLTRILEAVRGDAWWLDIPSLVNSILNRRNKASRSRRFWFNQVVASEEAWLDPAAVDQSLSRMAVEARQLAGSDSRAQYEAGWLVAATEPIVMFFDGSKSDDSTALVGCRLSDSYIFTIGVWQRPRGKRGEKWLAPREAVDARVNEAFKRFNIVAFWGDPSHTKDDEDSTRYWDGYLDRWMQKYAKRDVKDTTPGHTLDPRYFPLKSGLRKHAVMFDMAGPDQQKLFIAAAEEFVESMENLNDIEEFAPTFEIDGHPALVQHLKNAVRHPHPSGWGVSLMKEGRESPKKIDLAVCAVGARMLRRIVLNNEVAEEAPRDNTIWGVGW